MNDKEIKKIISNFKAKIPSPPKIVKVNSFKDARPMIVENAFSLHTDEKLSDKEYKRYKNAWFKEHKNYPSLLGSFDINNIVSINDTVSWNIAGYEKLREDNYLLSYAKWKERKLFFKENEINSSDKIKEYRKCVMKAFEELIERLEPIFSPDDTLVVHLGMQKMPLLRYLDRGLTTSSLFRGGLTISNKPLYKLARTLIYEYNCQVKKR